MKLSDYLLSALARAGIQHVFTVSGGGIMHLLDSLGAQSHLSYTANYHEQACAIAAEGYARIMGRPAACLVTTGPGSTNALSGVAGAWVDSIPMVVISGQVRRDLMADFSKVRQMGPQEINIDPMAKAVTKYFVTVTDPARIRYEFEKAFALATSGRPGPVWINLPLDVQGAQIDETDLIGFQGEGLGAHLDRESIRRAAKQTLELLRNARRPVLVPGNGVRLSGAHLSFLGLVDKLGMPVTPTIGSTDALAESHPLFAGRFGPLGQRCANFAIQNADFVLAIGASLSLASVGFNTEAFAPHAVKVMANVDQGEIDKALPRPDLGIAADSAEFIKALLELYGSIDLPVWDEWHKVCRDWRAAYPSLTIEQLAASGSVNSYVFADRLSDCVGENDVILTGNSLDWWSVYQAFKVGRAQRVFTNVNFGSMGWDLPAAIGASVANSRAHTVLVTGDGSLQFNLQELQTVVHNTLPIKMFILNNGGYASIRSMQHTHFAGRLVGADATSGVSNPDFKGIAGAYGIPYSSIRRHEDLRREIDVILGYPGPAMCEVFVDPAQERSPRVMSRRREDGSMESGTLQNMYPFLPAEEVAWNMRFSSAERTPAETGRDR